MMMILADSCCDLSPELLKKTQARVAPLTITIDDTHYVDDGTVDIPPYLAAMKASKNPVRSACPSPDLYAEDIKAADDDCFIITLSAKLSGSHNAAVLGVQLAEEDMPEKKVHVFDSESASAGETYLALMIHDLIAAGKSFEQIVETVEEKIRSMHTLFVLDSLDNLVKNGRISKTVALLANVLSIRLLMSDDGHGAIKNISKARGIKGALKMLRAVQDDPAQIMMDIYERMVLDEASQRGFASFFDDVLDTPDGAVLWHCTIGKDRAGLAAMLLLHVLGSSHEDILRDYEATNRYVASRTEDIMDALATYHLAGKLDKSIQVINAADPRFLQAALDAIDREFGGLDAYVEKALGITDEKRDALRARYLTTDPRG